MIPNNKLDVKCVSNSPSSSAPPSLPPPPSPVCGVTVTLPAIHEGYQLTEHRVTLIAPHMFLSLHNIIRDTRNLKHSTYHHGYSRHINIQHNINHDQLQV